LAFSTFNAVNLPIARDTPLAPIYSSVHKYRADFGGRRRTCKDANA
jgi:hypothetical protein